ncbi:MAG: hypothetical protein ACE5F5_12200 [Acidimicrobiia bacterium]
MTLQPFGHHLDWQLHANPIHKPSEHLPRNNLRILKFQLRENKSHA